MSHITGQAHKFKDGIPILLILTDCKQTGIEEKCKQTADKLNPQLFDRHASKSHVRWCFDCPYPMQRRTHISADNHFTSSRLQNLRSQSYVIAFLLLLFLVSTGVLR